MYVMKGGREKKNDTLVTDYEKTRCSVKVSLATEMRPDCKGDKGRDGTAFSAAKSRCNLRRNVAKMTGRRAPVLFENPALNICLRQYLRFFRRKFNM